MYWYDNDIEDNMVASPTKAQRFGTRFREKEYYKDHYVIGPENFRNMLEYKKYLAFTNLAPYVYQFLKEYGDNITLKNIINYAIKHNIDIDMFILALSVKKKLPSPLSGRWSRKHLKIYQEALRSGIDFCSNMNNKEIIDKMEEIFENKYNRKEIASAISFIRTSLCPEKKKYNYLKRVTLNPESFCPEYEKYRSQRSLVLLANKYGISMPTLFRKYKKLCRKNKITEKVIKELNEYENKNKPIMKEKRKKERKHLLETE